MPGFGRQTFNSMLGPQAGLPAMSQGTPAPMPQVPVPQAPMPGMGMQQQPQAPMMDPLMMALLNAGGMPQMPQAPMQAPVPPPAMLLSDPSSPGAGFPLSAEEVAKGKAQASAPKKSKPPAKSFKKTPANRNRREADKKKTEQK